VCGRLLTVGRESFRERSALVQPTAQERQPDQARPDQDERHRLGNSRRVERLLVVAQVVTGNDGDV